MPSFATHLYCSASGEQLPAGQVHNLSPAGKPLLVHYDLATLAAECPRDLLLTRRETLWRYRELLPMQHESSIVSLGEVMTPLLDMPQLSRDIGCRVLVKDESRLPTGSFKARGMALAVTLAKELGIRKMAVPTNGNAGAALAAYCSRAGMESLVLAPKDTPEINLQETALQGAELGTAAGLIHECGRFIAEGARAGHWFDASTLKEPYRIEGKKTMGLELAEQLGWKLPDAIFYPTGGGTGLIGMWKAFQELLQLGWLESPKMPRMIAVQAAGCAPIVRAFRENRTSAEPWPNARTLAAGIRVPLATGDFLILRALRESGGFALAVEDEEILSARADMARREGLLACPEGAATWAAAQKSRQEGLLAPDAEVVLFNCATGLKYPMPCQSREVSLDKPYDFSQLA